MIDYVTPLRPVRLVGAGLKHAPTNLTAQELLTADLELYCQLRGYDIGFIISFKFIVEILKTQ